MIVCSRSIFTAVLMISSALHLAAMTVIWDVPTVEIEGGAPVAEAALGSSFADMVEGVQHPVKPAKDINRPVMPLAIRPLNPLADPPVAVDVASPHPPAQSVVTASPPKTATAATVSTVQTAIKPLTVQRVPQQAMPPARTDAQPVTPDVVIAALPKAAAPRVSARPRQRVERPKPAKVTPAPKLAKPKGNADQNARAGTQTGTAKKRSQSRQAGQKMTRKAQGNAAASNYPGQIMRRISRVPRPRSSARGVAVIQFTIASNGNLASAGVSGSSGSAALDRAALAVVRKAQPFPQPPTGARRSYSIKIKGQ